MDSRRLQEDPGLRGAGVLWDKDVNSLLLHSVVGALTEVFCACVVRMEAYLEVRKDVRGDVRVERGLEAPS